MRASRSTVTVIVTALVLAASPIAPARAAVDRVSEPKLEAATPVLLADAVADGSLTQSTADGYLAAAYAPGATGVPTEYRSSVPWDGTLPLLHLRERIATMPRTQQRRTLEKSVDAAASTTTCSSSGGSLSTTFNSPHFSIDYTSVGGGLSISDYSASVETSWITEVDTFGWAAPPVLTSNPPPGNRYHVRIEDLGSGLYGFVSGSGTHAGSVGDNPNTPWNDVDARASCMVLNDDYSAFPGSSQQALDATTAHEFNHSLQFGYGALNGSNVPDDAFIEGGATWMEDEVMDASNDNYNYLWPTFTDSLGDYDDSPYPYWIVLRGITERFGAGVAGGGEQVMQLFWEGISQNTGENVGAFATALSSKGVTLPTAYHDFAIAARFNRPCGGGYTLPRCFQEATGYVAAAGANASMHSIASVGGSTSDQLEDDYSLNWVNLPSSGPAYKVTLANTSSGGTLRGSVVCDTGTALVVTPLPSTVGGGASSSLSSFNPAGCGSVVAVLTNQTQSAGNPSNPAKRGYTLSTATAATLPSLNISGTTVTEGDKLTRNANFKVTLSAPSASTVTVHYATAYGTAKVNDFYAKSGTLTFSPGQTVKTITVVVKFGVLHENTERFTVNLSSPSGATLGIATATGTIIDND